MKIRIEFDKNTAYAKVLDNYYKLMQMTLDTVDFVPEKFDKKIKQIMFKELKRKFREVDKKYDDLMGYEYVFLGLIRRKKREPKKVVEAPSNDGLSSTNGRDK